MTNSTTTKPLGATKRTILRAAMSGHSDGAALLEAMHPGKTVSTLSNCDLLHLADTLGLSVPTDEMAATYEAARHRGLPAKDALLEAFAAENNPNPVKYAETAETAETAEPETDEAEAEAQAKVKEIYSHFADGDLAAYQSGILELARAASKPAPVAFMPPAAQNYDTSSLSGEVATRTGTQTLRQAGIRSETPINDAQTALAVYDATDQTVDPNYIWPEHTGPIVAALAHNEPVFLYGPAGTGKTSFAEQLAAQYKRPFVRVSCDDQTEAAVLSGMTVPDTANGGVIWQDGQLAAAIRRPGTVILIDEPSVARPGALFVLQSVMDGARCLNIAETGERIPLAPDVILILADNTNGTGDETGSYEATRRLNRAFLDRPAITVRLDYMPADDEARILHARSGLSKEACAALVKFAVMTRAKTGDGDLSHAVGLRRLIALARQITFGTPPAVAFQLSTIETAPPEDREALRQIWTAEVKEGMLK